MSRRRVILSIVSICLLLSMVAAAQSIPAGTKVSMRTTSTLSSGKVTAGQSFEGSLVKDVVVNGKTVAKAGDPVKGVVSSAKSSGRLHAPGILSVRLTSVNGTPVHTLAISRQGKSHTKSNATKIGGGTAAGALLGGVFGGGKGALIGAGAGAAAGTGVAAATGKEEAVIPAETMLTFTVSGTTARR